MTFRFDSTETCETLCFFGMAIPFLHTAKCIKKITCIPLDSFDYCKTNAFQLILYDCKSVMKLINY